MQSRSDQRSRLLRAILEVVSESGYPQAKIGEIAERAGVSRATFYEQFTGKEACFLAAHQQLASGMRDELASAVADAGPLHATPATVTALVEFAGREPAAFKFLTHEAMLAGSRAAAGRDRLLSALAGQIEDARGALPAGAPSPDLPAEMLVGGLIRVLGLHMRRGQEQPRELLPGLLAWTASYDTPREALRWTRLTPDGQPLRRRHGDRLTPMMPAPLPRGRHRQPIAVVKRIQRERILFAVAEVLRSKGYTKTTVSDIVASAGLSREVFYAHFSDKRQACLETLELVAEQISAKGVPAFYTASGAWPERVWALGRATAEFIAASPSLAHCAFVESYALGPDGVQIMDAGILGYTVFLEEGYRHRPQSSGVPRLASDAIASTVMETTALFVRGDREQELPGLLPLITYLCLAPFTGVQAANEFIAAKLRDLEPGNGRSQS